MEIKQYTKERISDVLQYPQEKVRGILPHVTVREPICDLVWEKWIKVTGQHLFRPV